MAVETHSPIEDGRTSPRRRGWLRLLAGLRRHRRRGRFGVFSSLTRRIIILNLVGLAALVSGILYLNQFRAGLIDARVQSLLVQGEIIAGAIAASATVENDVITIDPERLLELQAGETTFAQQDILDSLNFPISPERVAPILRRLISPTNTRARIYDRDGVLILDSRHLYSRGQILRFDLPQPGDGETGALTLAWQRLKLWFRRLEMPAYQEIGGGNGRGYPEVVQALSGTPASIVRVNERGEMIVSVAVPVQRFRAVLGGLLLSTQGGDIDAIVAAERLAILRVFLVAAVVMVILSALLASTIAGPVRRLSDAAERVRHSVRAREELPEFGGRSDEIGHLARVLRDMTNALYTRMDAIERFAADVSHELKNPLTSLRSAVETLPRIKSEESRQRLLEVIQHDVRRLDRLISDISDASRLDAELAREDTALVDLGALLGAVVSIQNDLAERSGRSVVLASKGKGAAMVEGHESRLGQVFTNLIDNARSFSPEAGKVEVTLDHRGEEIVIRVEDQGPGLRDDVIDRVFERFYTDRPEGESFGNNSGLGLSISRQIVEAHHGRITAGNRSSGGAVFTVILPKGGD